MMLVCVHIDSEHQDVVCTLVCVYIHSEEQDDVSIMLAYAGCCYLANRKTRPCVKSPQVFLQNKNRHRSQDIPQ